MGKDTTAFRERFNAYKNGKSVSEIYDAGLPRYAGGTPFSDEEAMDYILQLENPNRVGYSKGIWRTPTDSTKYDIHQIGGGLDIREEHNPIVYNYLKSKNRLNDPWLTEAEEKLLRMLTWKGKKAIMDKFVAKHGDKLSLRGYDVAAGMLWHGHPFKMMNNADSITGKAFLNALASGDQDLSGVFDTYYGYGTNAKRFASRINANSKYWKNYKQILPVGVDKSDLVKQLENRPQFEYWQNYHQPDYSLTNPAPPSISSWNNPKSPAYTPAGLQTRRIDFGKIMMDMLEDDWEPPTIQPLKTVAPPDSKIAEFTGFKNGKLPGFQDGTKGWTRANGNDIKFDEETGELVDQVTGEKGTMMLPEVVIKPRHYDAYNSTYDPNLIRNFTDFAPIVGDIGQGLDAYNAFKNKDYLQAGVLGGMFLLPTALEKPGKALVKAGLKYAPEFTKALYDLLYLYKKAPDNPRLRGYLNELRDLLTSDKIMRRAGEEYNFMWANNIDKTPIHFLHSKYNFDRPSFTLFGKLFTSPIPLPRQYAGIYQPNLQQIGIRRNGLDSNRIRTTSYHEGSHASDLGRDTGIYDNLDANYREDYFGLDTEKRARVLSVLTDALHNGVDIDSWDEMKQFLNSDYNNKNYKDLLLFYDTLDGKPLLNTILKGYKNGKSPIHINPANRGKFNATKKRTGKTTEELAHSKNPLTRKRAIFALNARKWKH